MARIYTDGSCRFGIGGWAWWNQDTDESNYGYVLDTTNQRMEVKAVLEALESNVDASSITIVSDSAYVVNCFGQDWWVRWQRNNWLKADQTPVANRDLWEPVLDFVQNFEGRIDFEWVKGHSGDPGNDKVDGLAQGAVAEYNRGLIHEVTTETGSEKTEDAIRRSISVAKQSQQLPKKLAKHLKVAKADLQDQPSLRAKIQEEMTHGPTRPL